MTPRTRSAAAYLAARTRFGMKFGLTTIRALVSELGHPERAYPTLLVAGTNGKGSVTAYAAAALQAAGLRTGRYTSPHLVRVHERIAVDGREITPAGLQRALARVRRASERLLRAGSLREQPTYFEALTAAAFDHFRRRRVDVAVLEVGLGGRLDATNVAEPLVSAIVSVGLDHEAYLGRTLAAVAREKAGVLRSGRVTVLGPLPAPARRAIAARARTSGALLLDALRGVALRRLGERLELLTPEARYRGLTPLPGAHQVTNMVVALRLVEEARRAGLRVDLRRVPRGIAGLAWPGRLQWLDGDPPLLLDGAHNPDAARTLARELRARRPFVLLFGAMADKDIEAMARALFPLAAALVLTRPRGGRAAGPHAIARRAGPLATGAYRKPHVGRALARARGLARELGPGRPVVVAGSLYLVGDVLARLG